MGRLVLCRCFNFHHVPAQNQTWRKRFASKQPLCDALTEILAASGPTWRYLNKGTHEEENPQEFDRAQVELVVSCLQRIDALELRAGR